MERRRFRGDSGAVTTEFVIATPVLLSFLMLIVQVALVFHALSVASAAAQEGARTATMEDETNRIAAGEADAAGFVQAVAPRLLTNVDVHGEAVHGGEVIRMTVDADVLQVFNFPGVNLAWPVHETAESVVERFRPGDDSPTTG
jgi:Flp pilus assembly protein TadG